MSKTFPRPVSVIVGLGFPRRLSSLNQALAFLDEYPRLLRDLAYEATLDACRSAAAGEIPLEEAHNVFIAFARRRGILLDETPADASVAASRERLRA